MATLSFASTTTLFDSAGTPVQQSWDTGSRHQTGFDKQSRSSRHASMHDPTNIKRSSHEGSRESTPSRPVSRQNRSASVLWLDKKPSDFLRSVRQMQPSASEPALGKGAKKGGSGSLPAIKRTGAVGGAGDGQPSKRRSEINATGMIEAQKKADAEKELKDLIAAEIRADRMRQDHCHLVNQRIMKEAKHVTLVDQAANTASELAAKTSELDALRARLAVVEREAHELEEELLLEIDTTPRYKHIHNRAQLLVTEAVERCTKPKLDLEELIEKMERRGCSHLSVAFDAKSKSQALTRLSEVLAGRQVEHKAELAQLHVELDEKSEAQKAIADIMRTKHETAQKLRGDKDAEEEEALRNSASTISGAALSQKMEKTYTRDRANEIERMYIKLSNFFGTETPDDLVEKMVRYCSGTSDEQMAALNEEAEAAKVRQDELREELLTCQRRLETLRFEGEGTNPGYIVFTPRGENVMAYGGDEEVEAAGDQLKASVESEAVLVEKYRKHALLLTNISICLGGMLGTTSMVPLPTDKVPAELVGMANGGITLPLHSTPAALELVEERLYSTSEEFQVAAAAPHLTQPPEAIDMAAAEAVAAYLVPNAHRNLTLHVASWSEVGSTQQTPMSSARSQRRTVNAPDESFDPFRIDSPPLASPASGSPDGTMSMFSLPKAKPSSPQSRGQSRGSSSVPTLRVDAPEGGVLPPLPGAPPPPPSATGSKSPGFSLGSLKGFGSASHLAHVSNLQLELGQVGGNNIRIPLYEDSDEDGEGDAGEADDDDEEEDGEGAAPMSMQQQRAAARERMPQQAGSSAKPAGRQPAASSKLDTRAKSETALATQKTVRIAGVKNTSSPPRPARQGGKPAKPAKR